MIGSYLQRAGHPKSVKRLLRVTHRPRGSPPSVSQSRYQKGTTALTWPLNRSLRYAVTITLT